MKRGHERRARARKELPRSFLVGPCGAGVDPRACVLALGAEKCKRKIRRGRQ